MLRRDHNDRMRSGFTSRARFSLVRGLANLKQAHAAIEFRAFHDRRKSKNQMHAMLAGIPRAGAENPQRVPDELPALQSTDYVRYHFGRYEYPRGSNERQRGAHGA